jgi:putative endopeptidase
MSINLKDDFYTFVNYKWLKNNKIKDNQSKVTEFIILNNKNNKKIKKIILNNKLLKHVYKLGFKKKNLNIILPIIENIKEYDFETLLAYLTNNDINILFNIQVNENLYNNKENILYLSQPNLSINKEMYNNKKIYNEYVKYIKKYVNILNKHNIKLNLQNILTFEKKINSLLKSLEDHRNSNKYYNLIKYNDLKKKLNFDFDKYISLIIPNIKIKKLIVSNLKYLTFLKDNEMIKDYVIFKFIEYNSIYLSDELENLYFKFYKCFLLGIKKKKSINQKITSIISNNFFDLIGIEYAKKYFSRESKYNIIKMIKNIKVVMLDRIKKLDWMSKDTKKKALIKLKLMKYKVGYPNKIINYSKLKLVDNLFSQILLINKFLRKRNFKTLLKKSDNGHWSMGADEINAYYSPINNEIVFPAGILQPPFYNNKKSNAYNYGIIGFIIGHEICHGFDDQGKNFDEYGNLKNWWKKEDEIKYKKKVNLLKKQFDKLILNNNKINGFLTLGENIADLCGITIAYNAFINNNENLTLKDKKEFFYSYAKIWRQNIRDKELTMLIKNDVHSPGIFRVNQILKNIDEFYEIFDIKENDKMFIEKKERIKIF